MSKNHFPFQLMRFQVEEEREDERLWCDLLCSSSQLWCLGNDCRMLVLTIPISSTPRLEFVKLDLEAIGNLVWLPKLEDNTSPSRKKSAFGCWVFCYQCC